MTCPRPLRALAHLVPLLALAVACSDDDDDGDGDSEEVTTDDRRRAHRPPTPTARPTPATGGTGETVTIVASVPPTDHGWLGQIAAKAQEAAAQWDDVEFRLLEAADADSQASQIQTVINEEPDALVVLPYDGDQLTPIAEQAMEAGIPVVNVDRLFATPEAARATILGDNYDIGVRAARFIAEQLDCEGNVVEIQGIAGISVTTDRTQGFADTIEELCGDGIEIVAQQPADFTPGPRPRGDGGDPPGQRRHRRRVHPRRRHGRGCRRGDRERRPRGRDDPHRRRRVVRRLRPHRGRAACTPRPTSTARRWPARP